jgi:DNA-binding GntR family transcriptional regulator
VKVTCPRLRYLLILAYRISILETGAAARVSLLSRPEPLRDEVRRILREKVLDGELAPGEDINGAELAQQLGISRTPLREALLRLEYERLVGSRQGHGFYVWPVDPHEAMGLYELIGALESIALRSLAVVPGERIARLLRLDDQLRAADRDPAAQTRVHHQWHEALVEGAESAPLRDAIDLTRSRLQRYALYGFEFATTDRTDDLERVLADHASIAARSSTGGMEPPSSIGG